MNLDVFARHLQDRDCVPSTVRTYCRSIQRFAIWFEQTNGRSLAPAELTSRDVRDFREHCQTVIKAKPSTINNLLAAIRAYGEWLVQSGQVQTNPVRQIKLLAEVPLAPRSLDYKQLAALERELWGAVNSAATPNARFLATRDRAILLLLANTGLRVAEICGLELADVSISDRAGQVRVRRGKGNKGRVVPMNVEARRPIRSWLDLRPANATYLFCDRQGQPLRPRGVQRALAKYSQRAGVTMAPHVLRHTFAKSLADQDVREDQIAALLGHSQIRTTRRYTQPSEADLERAVARLEI